jgi:hypothetical protein
MACTLGLWIAKIYRSIDDKNDRIIGYKDRNAIQPGDFHRVSALWLTNSDGKILLAQRAFNRRSEACIQADNNICRIKLSKLPSIHGIVPDILQQICDIAKRSNVVDKPISQSI